MLLPVRLIFPFTLLSLLLAMTTATASAHASGAACPAVSSGAGTTTIAELYTSEGCDSCPPTDKWFSTLSFSRDGVVPLAFHVDYWDYIGWKDRFGQARFGERQRTSVTRQGSRTVYTPQVLLDGHDVRGLSLDARVAEGAREAARQPARAKLQLQPLQAGGGLDVTVNVEVPDSALRHQSGLFIAVTENKLASQVTAGENRGSTLRHDHVVRELVGPIPLRADGGLTIQRQIALPREWRRDNLEVAAFVQNERTGEILQAVAAPVCAAP